MKSILAWTLLFSTVSSLSYAGYGMYPTRYQLHHRGTVKSGTQVQYFGGPVISNVKVYTVFWGGNINSDVKGGISDFYRTIVNSTHMDWLTEYSTHVSSVDGRQGTNQDIGRGSFGGEYVIQPSHSGTDLTDDDLRSELQGQIANHVLPAPDANSIYMLHFPAGVSIAIAGMKSCQNFCAYHNGFPTQNLGNVYYGVIPDLGSGVCSFVCGYSAQPFDTTTVVSSHELLEAITDALPTAGNNPAYPQAWNTTDGQEVGDLCAGTDTPLKASGHLYKIQKEWSNAAGACADGPYQNP